MKQTILSAVYIILGLTIQGILYTLLKMKLTTIDQIFVLGIMALFKLDELLHYLNKKD